MPLHHLRFERSRGLAVASALALVLAAASGSPAAAQIIGPLGASTSTPAGAPSGPLYPNPTTGGAAAASPTTNGAASANGGGRAGTATGSGGVGATVGSGGVPAVTLGITTPSPVVPSTNATTGVRTRSGGTTGNNGAAGAAPAGGRNGSMVLCPQGDAAMIAAFGDLSCAP
ncbi:MAG TPA: hypothetical protein VKY65_19015 [Alphaproteobacteria bacterium]|nr:hypothetical protein [Alphaproteobacteria bacterium]